MRKISIGIQSFEKLINENFVYVDKTRFLYDLVTKGNYYFFARPRRFGKSLLISTLAAIFSGEKELFEGLAISTLPYEWKKYPIIIISFSDISFTYPDELDEKIKDYLLHIAREHHITLETHLSPGQMLRSMVIELSQKEQVVLLIDEYDYAILKYVQDKDKAEQVREIVKNFYTVIKGLDQYLKFVFLTGVSRFAKTSIFSGLNNLEDITVSPHYNFLVGYTKEEITAFFADYIALIVQERGISQEQLLTDITTWYDGYTFSKTDLDAHIYNPFSVMLFLKNNDFSNYWFESGTPTFLINLLKTKNYPMQNFEAIEATGAELGQFDIEDIELKTLLFQTGYLTIKGYDSESRNYILGYVNKETIDSLGEYVIKSMTSIARSSTAKVVAVVSKALQQLDFQRMHAALKEFFVQIPYTIQIGDEKYYQTIFYLIFKMLGADIVVEQPTNIGRIDAVLQTKEYCFIIEFKINATAQKALKQIETKKYYEPYIPSGKKIILVGITFDTTTRNVSEVEHIILTNHF